MIRFVHGLTRFAGMLLVFYHHLPAPRNQLMENIMYRGGEEIMKNWTASHDGTMVVLPVDSDEIIVTSVE